MTSVAMPQLGESVSEGTVVRWLKAVGDSIAVDEPLFEVATDKVNTEIPSLYAGVIREILVPDGTTVPVGTELARIDGVADARVPVATAARNGSSTSRANIASTSPACMAAAPADASPAPTCSHSSKRLHPPRPRLRRCPAVAACRSRRCVPASLRTCSRRSGWSPTSSP